jgi:hypothetical protein
MQVDHDFLQGLKHLCLHSQHLLKSQQRGGSGLASLLLLFSPLFSAWLVATRFLMLAFWTMIVDEIKDTQKNDSMGKGIVKNPQR